MPNSYPSIARTIQCTGQMHVFPVGSYHIHLLLLSVGSNYRSLLQKRYWLVYQENWKGAGRESPLQRKSDRTTPLLEPCGCFLTAAGEASVASILGDNMSAEGSISRGVDAVDLVECDVKGIALGDASEGRSKNAAAVQVVAACLGPCDGQPVNRLLSPI